MSNNQLAGFPAFGPRVDTEIIYAPVQTVLETPADIPASEPATAQVQITIAAGHLPTFAPYSPPWLDTSTMAQKYKCLIVAMTRNDSGASRALYIKYKSANTPTWSSAASVTVSNGYYGGTCSTGLTAWDIGDTQEVKLYSTDTGLKLLGYGMLIVPQRIGNANPSPMVDLSVSSDSASLFTGWAGGSQTNQNMKIDNYLFLPVEVSGGAVTTTSRAYQPSATQGICYCGSLTTVTRNAATPNFYQVVYPTRIAYTPIL